MFAFRLSLLLLCLVVFMLLTSPQQEQQKYNRNTHYSIATEDAFGTVWIHMLIDKELSSIEMVDSNGTVYDDTMLITDHHVWGKSDTEFRAAKISIIPRVPMNDVLYLRIDKVSVPVQKHPTHGGLRFVGGNKNQVAVCGGALNGLQQVDNLVAHVQNNLAHGVDKTIFYEIGSSSFDKSPLPLHNLQSQGALEIVDLRDSMQALYGGMARNGAWAVMARKLTMNEAVLRWDCLEARVPNAEWVIFINSNDTIKSSTTSSVKDVFNKHSTEAHLFNRFSFSKNGSQAFDIKHAVRRVDHDPISMSTDRHMRLNETDMFYS